jgi:hypothetical protein
MNPLECVSRTRGAVVDLPARFMMDGATYERGGALGFDGVDFYFAGRGGALGDVEGVVVAAAFVFFHPGTVAEAWERGRKVMGPKEAAASFAACGHSWAQAQLPAGVDYARLAELAGRVIAASSPAGVPLFAGWAALDEPSDPAALALHRLNVLRELRGGLHGAAVLAAGLDPADAVAVKTPFMAALFGWGELPAPAAEASAAWDRAEEATVRAMARGYGALDGAERAEFAALAEAASGA